MNGILDGMRIVEAAAFIAAPTAGLTLAQMGAAPFLPFTSAEE